MVLSSAVDASMWLEEGTSVKTVGFVLIELAMTAFGFSALFLDFYGGQALPPGVSFTYFTSLRGGPEGGDAAVTLGAVMTAFGGPLAILILSLLGLRHPDSEPVRFSLIGAVAVWSITILGLAVVQRPRGQSRHRPQGRGFIGSKTVAPEAGDGRHPGPPAGHPRRLRVGGGDV